MKLAHSGVAALLSLCVLCACTTDASKPRVESSPVPSSTPEASSPKSEMPAWHDKFTAEQIDAYEAALLRWQEYTAKGNEIYRSGRDTPQAGAVLREYSMEWQLRVRELAQVYDQGAVRIVSPESALSWKPISITDKVVVISQCTDYTNLLVTQEGEPVKGTRPDNLVTPLLIEMDKPVGRDWMVATTNLRDERPCAAR